MNARHDSFDFVRMTGGDSVQTDQTLHFVNLPNDA
jgi:hypothetical protein